MKTIAFEGPDKLGKSTQAGILSKKLGWELIKFPNESLFSGQTLRAILNKELPFEPASFQALQIINRLETFELLDPERNYIFDRYKMSGTVYGRCDGLPEKWVRNICDYLPDPDLTLVFYGTPFGQDEDIYSESDYQKKISNLYDEESEALWYKKGSVVWIHNVGSEENISHRILRQYMYFFEGVEPC